MAKPDGYWAERSPLGAPRKFDTPEQLWEACVAYFEEVDNNPFEEEKAFSSDGSVIYGRVAKMRPYTLTGLCIKLRITLQCWNQWREKRTELFEVIKASEQIIYDQKFSGAAAGFLNANLISRELGLADKREVGGGLTVNVVDNFSDDDE